MIFSLQLFLLGKHATELSIIKYNDDGDLLFTTNSDTPSQPSHLGSGVAISIMAVKPHNVAVIGYGMSAKVSQTHSQEPFLQMISHHANDTRSSIFL